MLMKLFCLQLRPSPIGAQQSPNSDLDEFDVITNRTKTTPFNGTNNNNCNASTSSFACNQHWTNVSSITASFLDDLDPLSTKKPSTKTPQSFLGENSSLVNLDNLIKPSVPNTLAGAGLGLGATSGAMGMGIGGHPPAYNPFGDMQQQHQKTNLFQQQTQPVSKFTIIVAIISFRFCLYTWVCLGLIIDDVLCVFCIVQVPSINQLKQSPFPVTLNQDPWAPVSSNQSNQVSLTAAPFQVPILFSIFYF